MPQWVFHHSPGAFTAPDKKAIAKRMNKIYTSSGLPPFYTHVHFFELRAEDIYAGGDTRGLDGENKQELVTLTISHIARNFETKRQQEQFLEAVDRILRPILKPRNVHWELVIWETDRELCRINGLMLPETNGAMERKWARENHVTDEEELLDEQRREVAKL